MMEDREHISISHLQDTVYLKLSFYLRNRITLLCPKPKVCVTTTSPNALSLYNFLHFNNVGTTIDFS